MDTGFAAIGVSVSAIFFLERQHQIRNRSSMQRESKKKHAARTLLQGQGRQRQRAVLQTYELRSAVSKIRGLRASQLWLPDKMDIDGNSQTDETSARMYSARQYLPGAKKNRRCSTSYRQGAEPTKLGARMTLRCAYDRDGHGARTYVLWRHARSLCTKRQTGVDMKTRSLAGSRRIVARQGGTKYSC